MTYTESHFRQTKLNKGENSTSLISILYSLNSIKNFSQNLSLYHALNEQNKNKLAIEEKQLTKDQILGKILLKQPETFQNTHSSLTGETKD